MADNKKKNTGNAGSKNSGGNGGGNRGNSGGFVPTFRYYADMDEGEQAAFKQGATTANNNIKERLGLKKPRE